ncbi:MAG: hypothetical protein IJW40_04970 [Clostridia bacterium]|nr:hypothetical protein [Clostridia bacterium]
MKAEQKNIKSHAVPAQKRGNVLDLLILLLLVAAIIAIGYRYYTLSGQGKSELLSDAEISFEITDAVFTLPSYVQAGDALYMEDGTYLGVLQDNNAEDENTALYVSAATVITTDEDGNYIRISYPDSSRVDCIGTLLCRGTFEQDGSFLLDGTMHLTPGSAIRVHTETAAFTVAIISCTSKGVS